MRILISMLFWAVICFGVRYAVGRETLRSPDHLHVLYQETKREFFGGQLPDVFLKVEDLSDKNVEGVTYKETEDRFVIVVDPKWNTSQDETLDTMRHESSRPALPRVHEKICKRGIDSNQAFTHHYLEEN